MTKNKFPRNLVQMEINTIIYKKQTIFEKVRNIKDITVFFDKSYLIANINFCGKIYNKERSSKNTIFRYTEHLIVI